MGIVSTMMMVALQRPRKRNVTSITSRKVVAMVSRNELTVDMMLSEVSTILNISTSDGSDGIMVFSCSCTPWATATELAPDRFCTTIIPPFSLLL